VARGAGARLRVGDAFPDVDRHLHNLVRELLRQVLDARAACARLAPAAQAQLTGHFTARFARTLHTVT